MSKAVCDYDPYSIMPNMRTVTIKLTRGELIKVLLAINAITVDNNTFLGIEVDHYKRIHAKLREQLDSFDEKHMPK